MRKERKVSINIVNDSKVHNRRLIEFFAKKYIEKNVRGKV